MRGQLAAEAIEGESLTMSAGACPPANDNRVVPIRYFRSLICGRVNLSNHTLVDDASALLLRAISRTGPEAVAAYREWRSKTTLDDASGRSHRILPLLADLIQREGLADPDLNRMQGASRHAWTQGVLNLRLLFAALDALAAEDVHPVLLKGVALFARSPALIGKRASGDVDIMVGPDDLARAADALRRRGFALAGHHWNDFGPSLVNSVYSGIPMRLEDRAGELDLHWRPLWNIHDSGLTQLFLGRTERRELRGQSVRILTATDQLFMAMARCEPWDADESFSRLLEAWLLLGADPTDIDWQELISLIRHYGLEASALAFLGDLKRHASVDVPDTALGRLDGHLSRARRHEWKIRQIRPERRSDWQRWQLDRLDARFHRSQPRLALPTRPEILLRRLGLGYLTAGALWRAVRDRLVPGVVHDIQFLDGFSAPEVHGCWSTGRWSAVAVPLTQAQQAGERVRLNAYAFLGKNARVRIVASGGLATLDSVQVGGEDANLEIAVRPLPELGGAGVILFWLPNAHTPRSAEESPDNRELGLCIRREWRREVPHQVS